MDNANLPIFKQIPDIKAGFQNGNTLILQAPPGAGKTTRVPLSLLDEPWLKGRMVVLLEPRRLAAVSCAGHMARLLGEPVGRTVGYQIRLDAKKSRATRILVVTEGIFTRMIQGDPGLESVGMIIFDEFHERSIHSDLGLALVTEAQSVFRPDLRVLIMSATIDTGRLSNLLDQAPVIRSEGRQFPVETVYLPDHTPSASRNRLPLERRCAQAVSRALAETCGDILVFLPGVAEIRRLEALLREAGRDDLVICPLYGNLPAHVQRDVFRRVSEKKRKIVIATAIAETSITIEGIGVVIDAGLMRQPRFSPQTGMSRLVTLPVSKASADQRRGRAGRTAKGVCYRLWSAYEQTLLKPFSTPEILSADLSGVMLELAVWGIDDPDVLVWMDPPEQSSVRSARQLLRLLGALDETGKITPHGKAMAGFGLHPRLSHMVLSAAGTGTGFTACRIAALLMEKEMLTSGSNEYEPDIGVRLGLIDAYRESTGGQGPQIRVKRYVIERIWASEKKIARAAGIETHDIVESEAGRLLAFAFPDRIAQKRNNRHRTYLTASGKGCRFPAHTLLCRHEYIVALQLDDAPADARIHMAAAYDRQPLEADFAGRIKKRQTLSWDSSADEVRQIEQRTFGRIVVEESRVPVKDRYKACDILVEAIRKAGLDVLPWQDKHLSVRQRAAFLRQTGQYPDLPDLSDNCLLETVYAWLGPFLDGIFSFDALRTIDMGAVLSTLLSWPQQQVIEKQAPTHLTVPSGSKIRLVYADRTGILDSPVLRVRLQEMFGLSATPKIASNRVEVTIHLLSPAGRPVQITRDLKSFWDTTYAEVKKDLMGRYPKHYWPENPYDAMPTNRVKPRN